MKALVLAAGEGTRLRPFTLDRPKPMVPVGGRPILDHLLALLRRHGVQEVAINLHYKPAAIVNYFGDGERLGLSITYSYEHELLGSAGALGQLEWFFDEPFFVLYGDVLTDIDLSALAARHRAWGGLGTVALYEVEDPTRCGVVDVDASSRIVRFVEKPAPGSTFGNLANAGIYVMEPAILRFIPQNRASDFGRDVFPALLEAGLPLFGHRADGYILDIGSPERFAQAEVDLRAGRFRSVAAVPFERQREPAGA